MELGKTYAGLMPGSEDAGTERALYLAGLVRAHLRKQGDGREVRPLLPGMEPARSQAAQRMRMMAGAPQAPATGGGAHVRRMRELLLANRHGPQ
ncbi:hypothetical protein SAMN05443665_11065 [Actinomadura meyerae]|uniref:Uncharacterized protein n=1 Tax=Actinomadura meyerae TaxID=240840 RepID=A0A239P8R7_9ACTN|nr:hypothetical protein [Actinomadura meyerae]SNT63417.1 hypothetical protein SAMN05443665_11065 [Actinomadura meyerae]